MRKMKVAGRVAFMALAVSLLSLSCKDDGGSTVTPEPVETTVTLQGNLSTQTLTKDKVYLLKGQVFVREGQTLTIQPGTVILGEKSSKGTLIIDRGAKIMAQGTKTEPIIMTSNQAPGDRDKGDWGGLVVLGKARVNLTDPAVEGITPAVVYGGTDDNDNSGVMEYLRVEFAGIELSANNETNAITLGGVGRGTKFENIMVSYGGDDGIEWFGGTVNGKNLIVFSTWDDCFDIDNGFSGSLQFGLAVRYPSHADQSESNGFEWDTDGQNNLDRFKTSVVASNFTIIGPGIDGNSYSGNFKHAVDLRRNTAGNIFNSVFVGYPTAFRFNHQSALANYLGSTPSGVIENNIFHARTTEIAVGSNVTEADAATKIKAYLTANSNTISAGATTETSAAYTALGINPEVLYGKKLKNEYPGNPNFAVTSGTLLTKGTKFTNPKIAAAEQTSGFIFDKNVKHVGAFGATDWTDGWANFDPINAKY
jgi:hypothetical protein